jgi:hypothetical protein
MGWFICILEPDHVQHVLEKNFKNYIKACRAVLGKAPL